MTNRELYLLCLALSDEIKKNRNKFIALLPEVAKRRLYLEHGMHSIYEFAAKLGCIPRDIVNRVLKVSEKLEEKPVLKEMFDSGEIGWSKLEVAVKLPIEEKEVVKILPTISKDALTLLVREAEQEIGTAISKQDGFASEEGKRRKEKETFTVKLHPAVLAQLRVFKQKLEREFKHPISWEKAFGVMMERLGNSVSKPRKKKSAKIKSTSRYIPVVVKREALAKTKQLCSKCNKPAEHLHHEVPFSVSRSHESIVPLCKAHHDLVHHTGNNYTNKKYQEYKTKAASLAKRSFKFSGEATMIYPIKKSTSSDLNQSPNEEIRQH